MEIKDEYINSLKDITGLNVEKLLKCYETEKITGVRFNTNKIKKTDLNLKNIEKLAQKYDILGDFSQISWCDTGFYYSNSNELGKHILHELGLYYLQEPSAMSPVEFLDINKDDVILDLCASPGGKSTQIAGKLENGFLVANEIVPQRAKVLVENMQRLGFDNVIVTNHSPKELENKFYEYFDKILVDAPCSGEGMFRKNDNAMDEWNQNTPLQCAKRQKEIIESAFKMLKPSGKMVYSTCTFSIEENEEIIKYILDNHSDLELEKIENKKYNFDFGIDVDGTKRLTNCARLYPYNIKGEGHFFAVIKKNNNENKLEVKSINLEKNNKKWSKNSLKSSNYGQNIKIFENFAKNYLKKQYENIVCFGEKLFANCNIKLEGIKSPCAGLYLGDIHNGFFTPNYHLAHSLKFDEFKNSINISLENAKKYIEGYEIDLKCSDGWVLLCYDNYPLSFGKCVNNKIKNHYPKYLRKRI